MRSAVIAIEAGPDGQIGERIECKTADEAAGIVANLLLRGYGYIHVDNLTVLDMYRATLPEQP